MGLKLGDISPLAGVITGKGTFGNLANSGALGLGAALLTNKDEAKKALEEAALAKKTTGMKKGGNVKSDLAQDKKMAEKAIGMHEAQLHGGKKSNLTKLKGGGCTKMVRGGGIEVRGKTKGRMV
jgi:hypothetical protein